jgi:hypothetical protein
MITARGAWAVQSAVVVLCLALLAATGIAAPANDYLIEPGKRVGAWLLGLKIEQYPLRRQAAQNRPRAGSLRARKRLDYAMRKNKSRSLKSRNLSPVARPPH